MTRLIEIVPGVVFAEEVFSPSRGAGVRMPAKGERLQKEVLVSVYRGESESPPDEPFSEGTGGQMPLF